jgi:ABC-type nitrate/sulfonate/bicarbonate transport system substrate-binding protein
VQLGSNYEFAIMMLGFERFGDYSKFSNNLLVIPTSEAFASIASGNEISAAVFGFPQTMQADKNDKLTLLEDLTPIAKKYGLGTLTATTQKFANENPKLNEIFNQVTKETIEWMNANPDEAAILIAEDMPDINPFDIANEIKTSAIPFDISETAYDTVAKLMYEIGVIPNPPKKFSELPNYDSIPKVA